MAASFTGAEHMSSRAIFALVAAALWLFTAACTNGALTETSSTPNAAGPSRYLGIIIITVPQPTDFVEITAGGSHTCARQFRGYVYCWGYHGGGQVGTLGSDPGGCYGFSQCVIQPTFVT